MALCRHRRRLIHCSRVTKRRLVSNYGFRFNEEMPPRARWGRHYDVTLRGASFEDDDVFVLLFVARSCSAPMWRIVVWIVRPTPGPGIFSICFRTRSDREALSSRYQGDRRDRVFLWQCKGRDDPREVHRDSFMRPESYVREESRTIWAIFIVVLEPPNTQYISATITRPCTKVTVRKTFGGSGKKTEIVPLPPDLAA